MTPTRTSLLVTGIGLLVLAGCSGDPADIAPTGPPAATSTPASPTASSSPAAPTSSTSSKAPATAPTEAPATAPTKAPSSTRPSASPDRLLRAGQTAARKVEGTRVTSIERGGSGWEVTVTAADGTRSELVVAMSGYPVTSGPRRERDSAQERAKNAAELETTSIDYAQAVTRLGNAVPDGAIRELSLDTEDGTSVWQAKVADGRVNRDIVLDAVSGDVRSNRVDD